MQLRARDGRALLAGSAGPDADPQPVEVDPHSLALGTELADALHEWARVADAVYRNGQGGSSVAAQLISRRGRHLAGQVAAVMGGPISYADPLTGEVTEVEASEGEQVARPRRILPRRAGRRVTDEPTPWATGLTVSLVTAILLMIVVVTLSLALGAANDWLPLIANVVIAIGLAPSVWLARRALVWRWVAYGVVGGIGVAWIALLFTAA